LTPSQVRYQAALRPEIKLYQGVQASITDKQLIFHHDQRKFFLR